MSSLPSYQYFNVTFPVEYVAHVEINRPSKLNSFMEPMWLEYRQVLEALSVSPSVRAVVLSGAGPRAFTTGLDVAAASSGSMLASAPAADAARQATAMRRHVSEFQACVGALERCEKPTICVMHGYAYGLAIDLCCCADVRVCARDVRFAVKEVDIGLAADVGTLTRLPKVVGNYGWVKDVCLSAREFGADEAERVGFVSAVYADKAEAVAKAVEWATAVAAKSPVAVQGTKELLNYSRDHTVEEGLRYTSVWTSAMLQTSDVSRAMTGSMQRKKVTFEKL